MHDMKTLTIKVGVRLIESGKYFSVVLRRDTILGKRCYQIITSCC